ncbi:MAG: hypothetical protein ABIH38_00260 [Patescibacteria group bacterium]
MFETSKDVLLWVLSACLAFFTFFLCWAIYLVIKMLRQGNKAIEHLREKIDETCEVVHTIKDKIINSATSLNVMASSVSRIINFFKERKEKKKSAKKDKENIEEDF